MYSRPNTNSAGIIPFNMFNMFNHGNHVIQHAYFQETVGTRHNKQYHLDVLLLLLLNFFNIYSDILGSTSYIHDIEQTNFDTPPPPHHLKTILN